MSEETRDPSVPKPAAITAWGIAEIKRQKALLKTGALQNAILNSANFSSIATDEKGVIQIFNNGAERMLGFAAADVLNKITPADISDPQEVLARARSLSLELGTTIAPGFEALVFKASRGIEDIYELTYIRKDSSRFPAIVSVTALRDAQGGIIGYLLIGTDNTARKQVEAERQHLLEMQEEMNKQLQQTNLTLQVSEERLAVTLKSIGDAVIATDAEARVTLLNPLAEQLTGWTQAEASGRQVDAVFHIINQQTRQPAVIPVMETLAHGAIQGLANHTVLIARDGSECAIADSCAPIRDRDGQVIGAVLVFRDVTEEYTVQQTMEEQQIELEMQNEELRISQEALRISQERYLDLYDFAPVGYCTVSEQGLILEANLTTATLLGLPRGELVKQPISRFIFNEDADIYYLLHKQLSKTGEAQRCELRMVNDGAQIWVQLSITAAQDNGAPVLYVVMNNINERKQAEEALFKAGALQRAIFDSANFSSIATDAKGVIQIFNVGAERMLGYAAADVMNKITPAEISDPEEVVARAAALSLELDTPITPGFEALVFKASRGIEDIYELTYIRKDGSRFPAIVSVTALRDDESAIIGYLLIGTDNTARKQAEEALLKAGALQKAIFDSANFSSIATDAKGVIQIFNVGAERMLGYAAADVMNKIKPSDISDPQEVVERAEALSVELGTAIAPGFEALVFKASRGIEDIYELTYIRKDGSRFPAIVSVTALRDDENTIIGYLLIGTDNTARKQAEEALLKAGALQKAIFDSANFSSIATDAKGVIQIFNVGAERMLGYAAADVMNKITPAEISDPQEVVARAEALSLELDTPITPGFEALVFKASRGIEDIYELTYIRKDGSRFPAIVSVTALRDDENAIIGYLLIGTDNTARKQAEEALLKAGALQSAIFNSANFSSIATDAKGVIQIFNVGAERMLGYTAADVMNKITPAEISDPQEVIARAKTLSAELDTPIAPGFEALVFKASRGIEDIYELTYIRKDGSRFPAVVSVTALRDAQGGIIGYLLIGTDNTARKQIEAEQKLLDQRLRDQQFYTRSLIESNLDAIMATDPSGIISDANKQMEVLTGCTRDELIGAPFKNYFTDPDRAEASIKLVLSEKKVINYELTARARDGKETVVSFNASTFYDRDRKLQGVFAAARDVTERKRMDQELESAKSIAEKANLAKSDFLSSMSHELRTPLNAILGFAQLLEAGIPQPTDTQIVRLHQIIKAGWYLLDLINEILDLALIESGKLSLSREPVSLIEVVRECQAMIEPQAQKSGIQINFLPFDETWFAYADRTRVKQVLINLLSNAIKYNREHGTVEVECTESAPGCIRITIKDTGVGLPPEKLAQLFQPFNRLGQEAGSEEGTGIGLVVTKQLVELMGGAIGVASTVGVGSEFWIEFIRDVTPEFTAGNTLPAELALQVHGNAVQRTLLYVEDNPANLMLVEQIIEDHPHVRMLSARDGKQGIALAGAYLPDVILMDINLPGLNGFQALKLLREDPLTAHIPVLAISANAMPRDIEKGREAGFFRYLTKPIKVNEFMNALNDALKFSEMGLVNEKEAGEYDD
jgi:PAS domain S-box-containing protein